MAFIRDTAMDALLNDTKTNAERMVIASSEVTVHASVAAATLGDVVIDTTDFTLADGDTSGRKWTCAAQTGVAIDTTGTASHILIVKDTATAAVLHTTALSATQAVTSGNTADVAAYDHEVADPT